MINSFLDTTVLVHLSDAKEPARRKSLSFVESHQPAEVAYYAAREILAGPVRYICDAHNRLLAAQTVGEAIVSLQQRFQFATRARGAAIEALAKAIDEAFAGGDALSQPNHKRETLQAIKLKAAQLWKRANKPDKVTNVQPLACFNSGEISIGPDLPAFCGPLITLGWPRQGSVG